MILKMVQLTLASNKENNWDIENWDETQVIDGYAPKDFVDNITIYNIT